LWINPTGTGADQGTAGNREANPFRGRSRPTVQQAGGESIAGAGGIHQCGGLQGWLNAGLIAKAPTHWSSTVGNDDIRSLRQGRSNHCGIRSGEEPERFVTGHLEQGCRFKQRLNRSFRFR
jgi:hypothetical protein